MRTPRHVFGESSRPRCCWRSIVIVPAARSIRDGRQAEHLADAQPAAEAERHRRPVARRGAVDDRQRLGVRRHLVGGDDPVAVERVAAWQPHPRRSGRWRSAGRRAPGAAPPSRSASSARRSPACTGARTAAAGASAARARRWRRAGLAPMMRVGPLAASSGRRRRPSTSAPAATPRRTPRTSSSTRRRRRARRCVRRAARSRSSVPRRGVGSADARDDRRRDGPARTTRTRVCTCRGRQSGDGHERRAPCPVAGGDGSPRRSRRIRCAAAAGVMPRWSATARFVSWPTSFATVYTRQIRSSSFGFTSSGPIASRSEPRDHRDGRCRVEQHREQVGVMSRSGCNARGAAPWR